MSRTGSVDRRSDVGSGRRSREQLATDDGKLVIFDGGPTRSTTRHVRSTRWRLPSFPIQRLVRIVSKAFRHRAHKPPEITETARHKFDD